LLKAILGNGKRKWWFNYNNVCNLADFLVLLKESEFPTEGQET
jgi:hypothetical protein